jgi:acyl-CoA synthetase (AMP-forming)/AMP-acid ligase II
MKLGHALITADQEQQPSFGGKQDPLFETWIEVLQWREKHQPEDCALTFLRGSKLDEENLTYRELVRRAKSVAAHLKAEIPAGSRVLLLYPSGLEFVIAFFGTLYAGMTAVPANPPRLNRHSNRLLGILEDAGVNAVLGPGNVLSRFEALQTSARKWLSSDQLPDYSTHWEPPPVHGDSLALLQYTSGSTSTPKGVMITHANLLANHRMLQRALEQPPGCVIVSWLPLFHDMGLIGNLLQALFDGGRAVLMAPETFLMKPLCWLEAVSRYGAHTSGGPNFAFDLCVRKIDPAQATHVELSRWEVAFNGAEPVRAQTMKEFANSFAQLGFRSSSFKPVYGLAEATLFVSGGPNRREPVTCAFDAGCLEKNRAVPADAASPGSRVLASCGHAWFEEEIAIVEPETGILCEAGSVGEIWVAGKNVANGYWNRDEITANTFGAQIKGGTGRRFLRTGDLGFIHEGELYIAGRLKDLILSGGRNHHPADIELTVERASAQIRPGCAAAFAVNHEAGERLVILAEVHRHTNTEERHAIFSAIRQAVVEEHGIAPQTMALLEPYSLPKTSSGKIQRQLCRQQFMAGSLPVIQETP